MRGAALVLLASLSALGAASEGDSAVIELTAEDFDSRVADGEWLVEFYAPWCGHCKRLAPTYAAVAKELKGSVNVAKVDGAAQRALAARFPLRGFPSIFHVKDGEVREYEGGRTKDAILAFAKEDWDQLEPLGETSSPFGILGRAKGLLARFGSWLAGIFDHLVEEQGWHPAAVVGVLAAGGLGLTLALGVLSAVLYMPKVKED